MKCEGYASEKYGACKNKATKRALIGALPFHLCDRCYERFSKDLGAIKKNPDAGKTIDIAQRIANRCGMPVLIRRTKRNPTEYTPKDRSLILRSDSRQITLEGMEKEQVESLLKASDKQQKELKNTPEQEGLKDTVRVDLVKLRKQPRIKIGSPEDVVKLLEHMGDYDRERAKIIHLDTKNRVTGVENISEGSLNASIVHPRESLKGAILNNSASVIFVHNHPSGNPEPSKEDRDVHNRLKAAFGAVGIDLLDSVIIGKEGFRSMKEQGL